MLNEYPQEFIDFVGDSPSHIMIILVLMRVNHFIYTMYNIYTEVTSNE
jgi:hypothetical protein